MQRKYYVIMTNLSYSSAFCAKTFGYLPVKLSLSSSLAPALHGKIPNSFRRITTRSVVVSLALFSLSCFPAHAGTIELTSQGSIVARVTNPTGGGNPNLGVIRDGDKPPVGNQDSNRQYDSYTSNTSATQDWVGYQYTSTKSFNQVIFQEGKHFGDGGWFNGLTVQVLQGGTWVNVPNVTATPIYPGSNNNVTYEAYTLNFPAISGDGIRVYGVPGGSAHFISVGELQVFGIDSMTAPTPAPTPTPTPAPQPTATSSGVPLTQAQFEAAINWDFEGENSKLPSNPSAPSIGYPCGVPNGYGWKFGGGGLENVASAVSGRGQQLAGAGYNQIYNACPGPNTRKSMPNARIEFTDLVVDYYSISLNKWVRAVKQPTGGAAFAEDFVNNQATGADIRDEAQGHRSVRSGIGNAASGAGASTGRFVEDGAVGFNFHGFPDRFKINWADAKAVVVSQAMRCIPHAGTDLGDCNKLGYLGQVGLDSWASTTSGFDNFATHGGVSGGRFKPVTPGWQVFTNYSGPRNFSGITAPAVPQF